ncbi:DUF637 domain-containing protein [Cupriavidus gilardii]|uniref:DUF637 domain-containing protein n=1 Tax=Cupriavidus gilardii TaxID=82541 RepID=UPI0020C5C2D8|nr:DUF637 domain-containing protein [Cupriavidus gilardii]
MLGNLVSQGAALGAHSIGLNLPGIGAPGSDAGTVLANALAHGASGCAAASATGRDCAGGAIGGATSAIVAPLVGEGLNIETNGDRADPVNRAIVPHSRCSQGEVYQVYLERMKKQRPRRHRTKR